MVGGGGWGRSGGRCVVCMLISNGYYIYIYILYVCAQGMNHGRVVLYDMAARRKLAQFRGHQDDVNSAAWLDEEAPHVRLPLSHTLSPSLAVSPSLPPSLPLSLSPHSL